MNRPKNLSAFLLGATKIQVKKGLGGTRQLFGARARLWDTGRTELIPSNSPVMSGGRPAVVVISSDGISSGGEFERDIIRRNAQMYHDPRAAGAVLRMANIRNAVRNMGMRRRYARTLAPWGINTARRSNAAYARFMTRRANQPFARGRRPWWNRPR